MNTYEMVERIIELTEKGKIPWKKEIHHDYPNFCETVYYTAVYKDKNFCFFPTNKCQLRANRVYLDDYVNRSFLSRLRKAVEKYIQSTDKETERKYIERRLRELKDILQG